MADSTDKVTFVFETKGGDQTSQQLKGIASALAITQKDADKAAAELRDLRKYLKFTEGTDSADKLKKKMDEFPAIMTKIRGLTKNLKDKEIKGLAGAFSNLTAKEQEQIATLNKLYPAVQKTQGITAAFKNGIMGAVPALGMMATGAGAVTVVFQKVIRILDQAIGKVKEFIESSIKLGAEQEQGRATMIALVGDIEAGTKAYDEFDKRVTDSPFKREIYNLEEYAAAVGVGMGRAYLDAAEAGDRYNFSAKSFTENMFKLERGLLRSVNTLGQFSVVMEKANLNVEDIRNGTISYAEAADMMREAVHELAMEQERMAGTTGVGSLNLIRNQWYDIKEAVGEILIKFLRPIGAEILKAMKETRDFKALWDAVKTLFAVGLLPNIQVIIGAIKSLVAIARVFNTVTEKIAEGWRFVAETMEAAGLITLERAGPESGIGIHGRIKASIEEGKSKEEIIAEARRRGASEAQIKAGLAEYYRLTGEEPPPEDMGGGGGAPAPIAPVTAAPRVAAQGPGVYQKGLSTEEKAAEAAKRQKELEDRYSKLAQKTGGLMADFFQASLKEGGLSAFFKNLGMQMASTIISALASSAIFTALLRPEGGFLGTFKRILGFEQEGAFTNITTPQLAMIHPGESIFNQQTIAALRGGGMPRGGRPGYEYGPETYGGGAAPAGDTYVILRPGVNAEVETYRMSERGRAIAETLDG